MENQNFTISSVPSEYAEVKASQLRSESSLPKVSTENSEQQLETLNGVTGPDAAKLNDE